MSPVWVVSYEFTEGSRGLRVFSNEAAAVLYEQRLHAEHNYNVSTSLDQYKVYDA